MQYIVEQEYIPLKSLSGPYLSNCLHAGTHKEKESSLVVIGSLNFEGGAKFCYVVLCSHVLVVGQYLVQVGKSKVSVKAGTFVITHKRQLSLESRVVLWMKLLEVA